MFYTNFVRCCAMLNKSPYVVASDIGVRSTATISGWRNGAVPRPKVVDAAVKYFRANGIAVDVADLMADTNDENVFVSRDELDTIAVREILRERPEGKILFDAAKDAPASALLEAAALIMRYKEESKNK